ncbi:cyclin-dependent kinase 20-like isoform X2 [Vidua chalybeata]|uniref:cyclin-dependent kinase 20-like isoform X2 n=1 Tax=Vidua chalybeata TaxID=81927 RepID=UPI0023A8068F|nr:cyclin-dependent kinase 20-like isoform X2 [Vidua chalybeata]
MTTRCRGRRAGHCGPVEVRLRPTMPRGTSMEQYLVLGRIGEGAHGVVFKAKHRETGELVALKKVPLRRPEDGVPPQTLREIKALREMEPHPHVIRLRAAFAQGPAVVLALELLVGDLGGLLRAAPAPLPPARVRALLAMTLRGLAHVHGQRLLHRDLKPANLLLDSAGHLKLADFGLARVLGPTPGRPYSHQVATRWYRAPELLYGARHYDEGVDLWAVGCIFGELLTLSPLFPGENDIEQLCCVLRALGTPSPRDWPELSELPDFPKLRFRPRAPRPLQLLVPGADAAALDLLQRLLRYRPRLRPRAHQVPGEAPPLGPPGPAAPLLLRAPGADPAPARGGAPAAPRLQPGHGAGAAPPRGPGTPPQPGGPPLTPPRGPGTPPQPGGPPLTPPWGSETPPQPGGPPPTPPCGSETPPQFWGPPLTPPHGALRPLPNFGDPH